MIDRTNRRMIRINLDACLPVQGTTTRLPRGMFFGFTTVERGAPIPSGRGAAHAMFLVARRVQENRLGRNARPDQWKWPGRKRRTGLLRRAGFWRDEMVWFVCGVCKMVNGALYFGDLAMARRLIFLVYLSAKSKMVMPLFGGLVASLMIIARF